MVFVCAGSADECVRRVRLRGLAGGHSAPASEIKRIYAASLANLSAAVHVFEVVDIYDSSVAGRIPRLVARARAGTTTRLTSDRIEWLAHALP